ncbi:MAG TPA: VPLPA-CTERM sorting domain-containing protein [Syntrophales bacterium]|nr:VPLPA-CTERM sorting domain-containing protein [Syntrophales bacterium]HPI56325.1 VPLPA-CTERM sorting domain-containing protein [Syntrophales bacterium]HPN24287.1 VPLPA-CTERM sorting domain-containing protein [Syntrophales bacterium]HQM28640.1 VPLPA-CTERM sorting domain-containing protein [Syntrophales bacterium]
MKRFIKCVLVAGIVMAFATGANAAIFSLQDPVPGQIPNLGINNFIPTLFTGPQIPGYYGAQVYVDAPAGTTFLAEFFGAEAGYQNTFLVDGVEYFNHPGGTIIAPNISSPLDTFSISIDSSFTGLAPFSFDVNSGAGSVANGSNPDDSAGAAIGPNFFASFNPFAVPNGELPTGNVLYLFLDDGGAGPDDDHDDFLVRVTATPAVPIPAAVWLLGSGLIGLVAVRRRYKK